MRRSILLLITDLQIGGTPTVVRELATRLNSPRGPRVDVACLAGHGPVVDELKTARIQTYVLGAKRPTDLKVISKLNQLIKENQYDTVFSFLLHANAAAAAVAPFHKEVRFLQSIQTTQHRPRWHWHVQAVVQQAAKKIVVPSPSVASAAEKWSGISPEKIVIIPNAVQLQDFWSGNRQPNSIGFIGRLDPIKRIPDLLKAVALLKRDVHLHIFGQGSERSHIAGMTHELGLASRVTLHGAIKRPHEALAQIEVLALPSAAEGFGLVLIEAMAAGVAVVATDVPGIRDVVRDGVTGLLVMPHSPEHLAKALDLVLRDQTLRQHLTSYARDDVATRFTWDVVLPQYRALLDVG